MLSTLITVMAIAPLVGPSLGGQVLLLAGWRAVLGDRAWVCTGDEAIEAGWFGERVDDAVRPRIGDVVVAARGASGVLRRTAEPIESAMVGQHGSVTEAEQRIPLLLAQR